MKSRIVFGTLWVSGLLSLVTVAALRGDVIHLNDGTTVEGTVKHNGDGWDIVDAHGKLIHVASIDVQQIELGHKAAADDVALDRLASLRNSVENLADLKQIIERFDRFSQLNKDNAAGREAAKELGIWKERLEKGMVKAGTKWMMPEERNALLEKAFSLVDEARRLLKEGRMKESDSLVGQVLAIDPANASALYLRGVVQYNQDQLPAARTSFESVAKNVPDCAPAMNNMAVILWRQNQQLAALNAYDGAMMAAPGTKEIINNVAEAMNALTAEQKNSVVGKKVQKHFAEQDGKLQEAMAAHGWHRWGATWVDNAQFEKLQQAEKDIQAKIDDLSKDFDATQAKITRIESDIDENKRSMHRMELESFGRDASGNLFQLPLPSSYYQLSRDNRALTDQRADFVAKLDALRKTAKATQQQLPVPKFTSVQQIIGVEGTPLLPPPAPQPTPPVPQPIVPPAPAPSPTPPVPHPIVPPKPSNPPSSEPQPILPPASEPAVERRAISASQPAALVTRTTTGSVKPATGSTGK